MRIAYPLPLLATLSCLVTPAFSADYPITVMEVSGKVLVTTATGVIPLEVGQSVADGSRIFVGDDAIVRLAKADGACDVVLPMSKITVVNSRKLCKINITPTASDARFGGLPPHGVGLGFFATVLGTAGAASLSKKNSVSGP